MSFFAKFFKIKKVLASGDLKENEIIKQYLFDLVGETELNPISTTKASITTNANTQTKTNILTTSKQNTKNE